MVMDEAKHHRTGGAKKRAKKLQRIGTVIDRLKPAASHAVTTAVDKVGIPTSNDGCRLP